MTVRPPDDSPWPVKIALSSDKRRLLIAFDDGADIDLGAELLRVESPSAEVQGHGRDDKTTPTGKRNITITHIEPVGRYAVRLVFSDGHDTGIYSWSTLYRYGEDQDRLMAAYCERLAALGASRD